jgi:chromatin remodeling complex protein RSC6
MAKKKQSAFMKPVQPSEALAVIVGNKAIPRTQVTKKLWDYIKKNKLQSKEDKRKIIPDAKLAKVLGSSPIDMFKMNAKISKHLSDPALAKAR